MRLLPPFSRRHAPRPADRPLSEVLPDQGFQRCTDAQWDAVALECWERDLRGELELLRLSAVFDERGRPWVRLEGD